MLGSAPFAELHKRSGATAAGRDESSSSAGSCAGNLSTEMPLKIPELLRVLQPNIPRLVQQSMKDTVGVQSSVFSYPVPEASGMLVPLGREVQGSRAAFSMVTGLEAEQSSLEEGLWLGSCGCAR